MKKLLLGMAIFLMAAVIAFPPAAHADITLSLYDGVTPAVIITDGGPGDQNPDPGAVTFIGKYSVWDLNVSTAISNSPGGTGGALGAFLDLCSVNHSTAAGNLFIGMTSTGFNLPNGNSLATMEIGGTTDGQVSNTANYFYDNDPIPQPTYNIGTLGYFGPGAFSGTLPSPIVLTSLPFSLTEGVLISHSSAGFTSFDAELNVVPIPASMVFLGSGLLGLAGWRRFWRG